MAPLRHVSAEEIESLAIGAWILGTGGGGSPYLALLNVRSLYRQGASVSLMDPLDLADDDLVAVVSNMGVPLVGQERFELALQNEFAVGWFGGAPRVMTPDLISAVAEAHRIAEQRAVSSGADRAALQVVDVEDLPLACLPGNSLRVRVRVIGDIRGDSRS